jgi:hypothetical protein
MRYFHNTWRLGIVLVCLLAVAACGGTSSPSTSTVSTPSISTSLTSTTPSTSSSSTSTASTAVAQSALCNGVTTINQALVSLSGVSVDTTVGDVRAAQLKVVNAVNAIHSSVPTADGTLLSQITAANAQLTAKLAGYPDSTAIGHTSETVQDVKTKVSDAQGKTMQLAGKLNCSV